MRFWYVVATNIVLSAVVALVVSTVVVTSEPLHVQPVPMPEPLPDLEFDVSEPPMLVVMPLPENTLPPIPLPHAMCVCRELP